MPPSPAVPDVARVIQLAVAPVFLLSGVGVTLTVLTSRLSRIVDRARSLEGGLAGAPQAEQAGLHRELATLSRRAQLINRALTLSTTCALLVCFVIATLFIGAFLGLDLSGLIALLFVVAMLAFIGGLVSFLREIFLATANLRIGPR
ncbi:MAG: hypothetical protein AUH07_09450 [Gemmatimonadetes bacterium 13_2_20CM_70_9]|nr:MAG: hypothetical protein AUH07_09450 [Gemmatimonadetes bacterium 13_2_20CM_70_9]PYO82053.1 MAG: DUF2721 domain-containing protein [Gemmatimonadota bacterium]